MYPSTHYGELRGIADCIRMALVSDVIRHGALSRAGDVIRQRPCLTFDPGHHGNRSARLNDWFTVTWCVVMGCRLWIIG